MILYLNHERAQLISKQKNQETFFLFPTMKTSFNQKGKEKIHQ